MIEFLTVENMDATDIHRHLKAVYGNETVDQSTASRQAIKFHATEAGKSNNEDNLVAVNQ